MAELARKVAENVAGAFYVDDSCIDCELCRELAPEHFVRSNAGKYSYVFDQPQTEPELAACLEALVECPVEAIGRDGGDG